MELTDVEQPGVEAADVQGSAVGATAVERAAEDVHLQGGRFLWSQTHDLWRQRLRMGHRVARLHDALAQHLMNWHRHSQACLQLQTCPLLQQHAFVASARLDSLLA